MEGYIVLGIVLLLGLKIVAKFAAIIRDSLLSIITALGIVALFFFLVRWVMKPVWKFLKWFANEAMDAFTWVCYRASEHVRKNRRQDFRLT